MWFRKRKDRERRIVFEFSHWLSGWETHRQKQFRQALFRHAADEEESVFTVIVERDISATQLREVESYFEADPDLSQFRFRSELDDDPAGASLQEVSIGNLVVDVDVYYPGFDPGPGFFGMDSDQHLDPGATV